MTIVFLADKKPTRNTKKLMKLEMDAGKNPEYVHSLPAKMSFLAGNGVVAMKIKQAATHLTEGGIDGTCCLLGCGLQKGACRDRGRDGSPCAVHVFPGGYGIRFTEAGADFIALKNGPQDLIERAIQTQAQPDTDWNHVKCGAAMGLGIAFNQFIPWSCC